MINNSPDRIGIVGTGALGGLFGAYLQTSGNDVVLVDRKPELVERIAEDGLVVDLPDGSKTTVHPRTMTKPSDVQPVDVLFLFVKAIHTEAALRDALPMLDENTIVVTVQNGLRNVDTICKYVPTEQVVGGTTTEGSSVIELGHVNHTGKGTTKIGGDNDDAAAYVADLLNGADFETSTVADPESHIWEKQIASVAIKPTAALTELLDGPLVEYHETVWVMKRLVEEAVAVAESKGVELDAPDPFETVREVCEVNYDTKSSMLEDVQKHRETEIEHINGAIVDYGNQEGVPTPFNEMAVALVKGKERSYLE